MATPEQLLMVLDPDGVLDMMASRKRIKQETQDDDYDNDNDIIAKPGRTESIESDSSSEESCEDETDSRRGETSDCSNQGSSDETYSGDESFDEDQPPINAGKDNLYNNDVCTIIPKGGSLAKYEKKRCSFEGCLQFVQSSKLGVCRKHGGKKVCSHGGCTNWSRRGGVCQAHGGKKFCSHPGCEKQVQNSGLCRRHGAKPVVCVHEGCTKWARSNGSVCRTHGATLKICSHEGCTSEVRRRGKCSTHGEKRRRYCCSEEGCATFAIVKGGVCIKHGAKYKRKICIHEGCTTPALNADLCYRHGGRTKKKCCTTEGCTHRAVSKGVCIKHGAVVKKKDCSHPLCTKKVSKAGLCWRHGDKSLRCKHPDCGKIAKHAGLCRTHCDRSQLKRCDHDGCEKFIHKAGRCWSHQLRMKCTHEGCTNDQQNGGLCPLHWAKKIGHVCSVEGCKDKAAKGGVCKIHLRTIDVGCHNHNGKQPRTAPKTMPMSVSKSLTSKFKPLAKETGDIYSVEEQRDNATNGGVCQEEVLGAMEEKSKQISQHSAKAEKEKRRGGRQVTNIITKPTPKSVCNPSVKSFGGKFKPLARKSMGGKFKPLKR